VIALNFPSSPVDGQIFGNYRWDATIGVWRLLPEAVSTPVFSDLVGVSIETPVADELLQYDGSDWVNVSQAEAGAIPVFDDAAARTAAIPSPSEGMVTYLKDTDKLEKFDGSAFVDAAPGKILQVVSTAKTDVFTTASSTYVDITGLSVSITPTSASSKIFVTATVIFGATGRDSAYIQLMRDSTALSIGDSAGSRVRATSTVNGDVASAGYNTESAGITFLDTPNTTSSTTYKFQIRRGSANTAVVNRDGLDSDSLFHGRFASQITVMEVAG
jgi:hypothetical protein